MGGPGIRSGDWSECTVVVVAILGTNNSMSYNSALVLAGGGVVLLQVVALPAGSGVVVAGRSVEHCWGRVVRAGNKSTLVIIILDRLALFTVSRSLLGLIGLGKWWVRSMLGMSFLLLVFPFSGHLPNIFILWR